MANAAPTLLAKPYSLIAKRGLFATKHLWVTPYTEEERYPSGDWVLQGKGGEGLEQWIKQVVMQLIMLLPGNVETRNTDSASSGAAHHGAVWQCETESSDSASSGLPCYGAAWHGMTDNSHPARPNQHIMLLFVSV